jgi:hypothetical protein
MDERGGRARPDLKRYDEENHRVRRAVASVCVGKQLPDGDSFPPAGSSTTTLLLFLKVLYAQLTQRQSGT